MSVPDYNLMTVKIFIFLLFLLKQILASPVNEATNFRLRSTLSVPCSVKFLILTIYFLLLIIFCNHSSLIPSNVIFSIANSLVFVCIYNYQTKCSVFVLNSIFRSIDSSFCFVYFCIDLFILHPNFSYLLHRLFL